jgi:dihydrolipoamide dehydrogenase
MTGLQDQYDVIVIGDGVASCTCAIRCGQYGLKTLLVNWNQHKKADAPFSVNIPNLATLTLQKSAEFFDTSLNNDLFGIFYDNITIDFNLIKDNIHTLHKTYNHCILKHLATYKVDFIAANAQLAGSNCIRIQSGVDKQIHAKHIVLATDSQPISLKNIPIDNVYIYDSKSSLLINDIPKRIAIIGAGVIGLEIASIWRKLGTEIILLEAQENFLEILDSQLSREAYRIFTDQGMELRLGTRVTSATVVNQKVTVEFQDSEGKHALRVDKLIVAPGRTPTSDHLSKPEANLLLDENGYVYVNENYRTNLPNIYAIGDLIQRGSMLPHKGMAEADRVADIIAGKNAADINYNAIPNVIYSDPQIAWVGQTEQLLKLKAESIEVDYVPINNHFYSRLNNNQNSIYKIISHAETDEILGIHIISKNANELIAVGSFALEFHATKEDLKKITYPYYSFHNSLNFLQ